MDAKTLPKLTAEERQRQRQFSMAFRKWWERAFQKARERNEQQSERPAA